MDTYCLYVLIVLSHLFVASQACDDWQSLFIRPYDPLSSARLSWSCDSGRALSGCSLLRPSPFYVL